MRSIGPWNGYVFLGRNRSFGQAVIFSGSALSLPPPFIRQVVVRVLLPLPGFPFWISAFDVVPVRRRGPVHFFLHVGFTHSILMLFSLSFLPTCSPGQAGPSPFVFCSSPGEPATTVPASLGISSPVLFWTGTGDLCPTRLPPGGVA